MSDESEIFTGEDQSDSLTPAHEAVEGEQGGAPESQTQNASAEAPSAEPKAKAAQPSEKQKFKIKVDDQEFEKELDLKNEDEVKAMLQKAMAFERRSNAIGKREKEIETFMNQVKQADLIQLAKLKGLNEAQLEEMAAQLLLKRLEHEQMTPEQRELAHLKQEKAQREEMEKSSKQELLTELSKYMNLPPNAHQYPKEQLIEALNVKKAEYSKAEEDLDKEIAEAWNASGLPKTKTFVTHISQEMYGASLRGEPLTAKDASAIVKGNWHRDVKETLEQMDAQAIHDVLGEAVLKKIRKYDVERVSQGTSTPAPKIQGSARKPESQPKKHMTESEWADWHEKRRSAL